MNSQDFICYLEMKACISAGVLFDLEIKLNVLFSMCKKRQIKLC